MKTIKAWAVVGQMKNGELDLNAVAGPMPGEQFQEAFDNIYPVYDNKKSAEFVVEQTPVLALKVVPCTITYPD